MSENKKSVPVGIDLGTTYSAVAFVDSQGRPMTIENSEGESTTPSIVFFDRDGVIVGSEAELAGEVEPERLARLAKRDMGGAFFSKEIMGKRLRPEVIQSLVLHRLKNDAELRVGEIQDAVVTVPAYFNEPRRKATQDAGKIAGLNVIDIINEPTAAALAYGVQRGFLSDAGEASEKEIVLVYDLGGGTFDVTLMEIDGSQFSALATAGDVYLGGVDWDRAIFDFATKKFQEEFGIDCAADPGAAEKLMRECTRAKKSLSARKETIIRMDSDGKRVSLDFRREQFEEVTRHLLERTRLTTERLLNDAGKKWSDLTKLLLVGGSTRMPMVARMLEKESGLSVDRSISPDEAVAHGAAIYAGILMKHGATAGKGISVSNVNSHDLGVLGLDPKTRESRRQIIIPKNHRLPATNKKRFQTSKPDQRKVLVQVVEGGTDNGQGATHIGKCVVEPLPEGLPKGTFLDVEFRYSTAGRLEVMAELPGSDCRTETRINRAQGLGTDEITKWLGLVDEGFRISDCPEEFIPAKPQPASEASAEQKPQVPSSARDKKPTNQKPTKDKPPILKEMKPESTASKPPATNTGTTGISKLVSENEAKHDNVSFSEVRIDDPDVGGRPSDLFDTGVLNELSLSEDGAKELASESMLDLFSDDDPSKEKASASDTSLKDFLKGLE